MRQMTDKKHKKESDKKRRTQDISIDSTYSISAFLKKQKKKKKKTDDDQNDDGTRSARLDDEDDVRRAIRESTRTPRVEQEDDVECIFFIPRDDVVDDDCTIIIVVLLDAYTTTTERTTSSSSTSTTTKQKKQNGRGDESRGRCRGYFRGRTKARPHDGGLRATRNHLALDVGKISPGGRFQRRPSVAQT